MTKQKISLIAALSENRVIGSKGKIPWHIPEDLKRFRKLTQNHAVIMGRKTFESIDRLLPNRLNIIVTRNSTFKVDGGVVCNSLEKAIAYARASANQGEIFIIGGGQIYQEAVKFADKLYLTIVKGNFVGDAFFPDYSQFKKVILKKENKNAQYRFTFLDLER